MANKIITIDLDDRGYDIYIGSNLLDRLHDYVPEDVKGRKTYIVTDKNVEPYAQKVQAFLKDAGASCAYLKVVEPGEKTKSIEQYDQLCQWMLQNEINRGALVFAVGGGVIGDLTGFTAATVMRGVSFVQIPTTLLSQVDSSVGGKTGINTPQGKNLVGAFHQPVGVITDIETLKTLPKRELLAGYVEMAKHALINDAGFFKWLEDNARAVVSLEEEETAYAIEQACQIKASVVQSDETEQGNRALLNLGHTFGHGIEAAGKYDGRVLHGEAVAIGTIMAFDLSERMGLCDAIDVQRVQEHFSSLGIPTRAADIIPSLNTNVDALLNIMGRDKKVKDGKMTFILVNGIGEAFISQDVPVDLVRTVIEDSLGGDEHRAQSTKLTANHSFMGGIKERWKSAFSSQS